MFLRSRQVEGSPYESSWGCVWFDGQNVEISLRDLPFVSGTIRRQKTKAVIQTTPKLQKALTSEPQDSLKKLTTAGKSQFTVSAEI
jgi:hypothetical protein